MREFKKVEMSRGDVAIVAVEYQQHTPGPWNPTETTIDNQFAIRDGLDRIVALTAEWDTADTRPGAPGVVGEANARLIAAAPELLLAVKGFALYLKTDGRHSKELEELIAKAEGRG